MKIQTTVLFLVVLLLTSATFVHAGEQRASSLTLRTVELSLENVSDIAGLWQHESGRVYCENGQYIGDYALHRRITLPGTSFQNTAMVTMTIFFVGERPPQNLTLQGSHDFSSGKYIGSVSAASSDYAMVREASFSGNSATARLTVSKLGSDRVNPCD